MFYLHSWRFLRLSRPYLAAAALVPFASQSVEAGVRGVFDFPREVAASVSVHPSACDRSSAQCYEITIPVSFRTTKGSAAEVQQVEVELAFGGDEIHILGYEPKTTLAGDVVGEIEETVTMEESNAFDASVSASIPIPGLEPAQIGPSVNASDAERTVRTKKIRRRPQLSAVVVSGSTARGSGVFFQLRPAPDLTLEGAHYLVLQIAAPAELSATTLAVKCRAIAPENWLLFEREKRIATTSGQINVSLAPVDATSQASHHHPDRPCPICDADP